VRVLTAHKKPVNSVAFSPDGARLAEAAHGGTVRLWDLAAGEVVQTFDVAGLFRNRMRLAFEPDGMRIAAANGDLVVLDVEGDHRKRVRGGAGGFYDAAFSPDGAQLVGAGDRCGRYDPDTGLALPRLKLPVPGGYREIGWPAVAFSPDGTRLAISRRVSRVVGEYWRTTDGVLIYDLGADAVVAKCEWTGHPAHRLAFNPDGTQVAAACGPVLRVWDVSAGALVAEKQVGKLHFLGMAYSPDGRYVATVSKDHLTRLWDVGGWGEPRTLAWNVGKLLDVAFSPDRTTAAVASDTGKIVLFDLD
jgi:WD40 repeat protein